MSKTFIGKTPIKANWGGTLRMLGKLSDHCASLSLMKERGKGEVLVRCAILRKFRQS